MARHNKIASRVNSAAIGKVADAVLAFIGHVPPTHQRKVSNPAERSRLLANSAARNAALTAGTLALPPGPFGWLTILPDLIAIWKIQAQLISDMAGAHGKKSTLTQEQVLFCLFRHSAAQAVRDLVVRTGERVVVRRASLRTLQVVARKIGLRVTQRTIGKGLSRMLWVVGALGVAGYAYYDTAQVAKTAADLFQHDIEFEPDGSNA